VRVPDDVRDSVVFVCVEDSHGVRPIGTAFFMGVPVPGVADLLHFAAVDGQCSEGSVVGRHEDRAIGRAPRSTRRSG